MRGNLRETPAPTVHAGAFSPEAKLQQLDHPGATVPRSPGRASPSAALAPARNTPSPPIIAQNVSIQQQPTRRSESRLTDHRSAARQGDPVPQTKTLSSAATASTQFQSTSFEPPAVDEIAVVLPESAGATLPAAFAQPENPADRQSAGPDPATLDALAQDFAEVVNEASADPSSDQYKSAWKSAQKQSDEWFRVLYGQTAYNEYHLQAAREAAKTNAAK